MAAAGESCRNRKRKKLGKNRKKLLVNQKVEVRSLEDGFLGSWHVGTVISSGDLVRRVQYDHLLNDDSSDKLIDSVKVTPMIDGVDTGVTMMPQNYRGIIRPLPPSHDVGTQCLHYGQCVDAYVNDAWWEGVIFDHEDDCEQRKIFFPEGGDEMVVGIDMLRLSQVWDEVTDEWEPRKSWLFLELIEEVARDWSLPISIKQIWYEVRVESGFQKLKDWTSSALTVWRELMLQVLVDNFKITIQKVFEELNSSADLLEEGQPLLEFSEPAVDVTLNDLLGENLLGDTRSIVPFEATCKFDNKEMLPIAQNEKSHSHFDERNHQDKLESISKVLTRAGEILGFVPNPEEASRTGSINQNEAALIVSSDMTLMEVKSSRGRKKSHKQDWHSVVPDLVPGPENCPEAYAACCEKYKLNEKPSRTILLNARKHLLHLGWKIEVTNDEGKKPRMRYFSPDGEVYYSIRLMCSAIGPEIISHCDRKSTVSEAGDLLPSTPPKSVGNLEPCSNLLPSPSNVVYVERQYWPQAVKTYCSLGLEDEDFSIRYQMNEETRNMASKAMKHLSVMGWSFYNHGEGDQWKLLYSSPDGKLFNSLHSACKHFVDTGGLTPKVAESSHVSMSKELVKLDKVEDHRIMKKRKERENQPHPSDCSPLLKKGRISTRSMKVRGDVDDDDDDSSTPVLRSCKKAREMVSPTSHRNPRTVLSWLIDNNVVLPRAKVQYRGKDGRPIAEGRITRDGIKCSCCQKTFTLSKFEAHAGSSNHRPSANIYLEDGRSLVECQLQLRRDNSHKSVKVELRKMKVTQTGKANDYICSVCHYGGELILCDNCPSSFHIRCLGLEGVPDGDWFCPTCCCEICGGGGFDKSKEQCTNSSVLICAQCEHQYHVGCLRNKGFEVLDDHIKRNWFCKETCEQIFWCLRNVLGIPIPVGSGNLTWTLLKYIKADSDDHEACDNEFLMESYSKLNIALSVMHECFEPVKESRTRGDLMEDVIFSRWSDLNRLNFQGFYTVLLERNDELISVATVRIYGKKVAEVPLIATRFQYRRLGMCRILMDELEKKLMEIGVERLVLPAVPAVLNTWTSCFGFSVMTEAERLNFLDNTFLDFQDTVMCQKVLNGVCSSVSTLPTETKDKSCAPVKKNDVFDGDDADSAVSQADQVEEGEFIDQGSACVSGEHDNENRNNSSRLAIVVREPKVLNCTNTGISVEHSARVTNHTPVEDNNTDGMIKCYKRRKISAC